MAKSTSYQRQSGRTMATSNIAGNHRSPKSVAAPVDHAAYPFIGHRGLIFGWFQIALTTLLFLPRRAINLIGTGTLASMSINDVCRALRRTGAPPFRKPGILGLTQLRRPSEDHPVAIHIDFTTSLSGVYRHISLCAGPAVRRGPRKRGPAKPDRYRPIPPQARRTAHSCRSWV